MRAEETARGIVTESVGGYRTLAQLGADRAVPSAGVAVPATGDVDSPWTPLPATSPPPPAHAPGTRPPQVPWRDPRIGVGAVQPGSPLDQTWWVPGIDVELPTATRVAHEGAELLRRWHPRDPDLRVHGQYETPRPEAAPTPLPPQLERTSPADASGAGTPAGSEVRADKDERSGAAKVAMLIGIGGGLLQNGVDVARLLKKYPEAVRAGQFDPSLGRMGRLPTAVGLTFLTRADNRIVDPTAPRVATMASAGKSFTHFDEVAMKASVLMGASLAALQIGSSIPNLADALDNEGPWYENLAMSTSGRAGVLQLTGGTIGATVFANALRQTAGEGGGTLVGRVLAAGKAPIMARPIWGRIGLATGAIVAANELGFFDRLNRGETRPLGKTLTDATHRTPVLNDSAMRTGAILAAGGVVGFKAHRAVTAAGGLSGLRTGHVVGSAVVAALLGAQLLGGLHAMDKPAHG